MSEWPDLLYPKDLSKMLGIKPTKLYWIRKEPDFPKPRYPHGKRPMYVTEEIREWMRNLK